MSCRVGRVGCEGRLLRLRCAAGLTLMHQAAAATHACTARTLPSCSRWDAGRVVAGGSSKQQPRVDDTAACARGAPGVFYDRSGQPAPSFPFLLRVPPPGGSVSSSLMVHSQEGGIDMERFFSKHDAQAGFDLCLCRWVALGEGEGRLGWLRLVLSHGAAALHVLQPKGKQLAACSIWLLPAELLQLLLRPEPCRSSWDANLNSNRLPPTACSH